MKVPIPQEHGGALLPGNPDAFKGYQQDQKRIWNSVIDDGDRALEEIHADLTIWTKALLKRKARTKPDPGARDMDIIKEFRLTLEAVSEARRTRGALAEAKDFFAEMDARLAENAERLAAGPVPAVALAP